MSVAVWLGIGTIAFVLGMYVLYRKAEHRPRPVLPAHYDVENYSRDPSKIPGWCSHCETMNDPGYTYCENCAARLPEMQTPSSNPYSRKLSS